MINKLISLRSLNIHKSLTNKAFNSYLLNKTSTTNFYVNNKGIISHSPDESYSQQGIIQLKTNHDLFLIMKYIDHYKNKGVSGSFTVVIPVKRTVYLIITRGMHRSRETAARATYTLFEKLFEPQTLSLMSRNDKQVFINTLMEYSFNTNDGVLQHKANLLHQIFREKYSSNIFKEHYLRRFPDSKVDFVKNILTDFRIFGELPVIRRYEETFSNEIKKIILTSDSVVTTFDKQKQTNPDALIDLESSLGSKSTYQDIKSGIVKHSTRGSLDLITFDSNKQVIPFTTQHLTLYDINRKRLNDIELGLKNDSLFDIFQNTLIKGFTSLNTEPDIFRAHANIRDMLWREIQCHPQYNRSIAFTFIEHQDVMIMSDRYQTYKNKFISLLGDKMYDPNKMSHRKEVFNAMLRSYKEVEPDLAKKFKHMIHEGGINVDTEFMHIIAGLIKETLI